MLKIMRFRADTRGVRNWCPGAPCMKGPVEQGDRWVARIFRGGRVRDEGGFSVIESTVAIGLFATVLLGMLGSLSVGVRGVLTGRQRNNAVGIADQVMEQFRGMRYDRVGHVATDPTLATDTSLSPSGSVPVGAELNRQYAGEQLVGSTVPNPNFYLNQHIQTARPDGEQELDGNTFTVRSYVTAVPAETLGGLPGKRATVVVTWDKGQYDSAGVASQLNVSSLLSPTVAPSPVLTGLTEATGGSAQIENDSGGSWFNQTGVSSNEAWFGSERGTLDFGVTDQVSGSAAAGRTLTETPGGFFGWGAASTECEGTRAETLVDNDGDGALDQSSGSLSSNTCSAVATWFSFLFGRTGAGSGTAGGTVQVDSTVDSCSTSGVPVAPVTCSSPRVGIGDNDGFPYQYSRAIGPDSVQVTEPRGSILGSFSWWFWGTSSGNLLRSASGAAAGQWDGTLDVDDVGGFKQLSATTTVRQPGMEYASLTAWRWSGCSLIGCSVNGTLSGTPLVTVSPINLTAVARSGQGHPAAPIGPSGPTGSAGPDILSDRPDIAGVGTNDPVRISIYDTTGAPGVPAGFKTLDVTPGVAGSWTYTANLLVDQDDSTFGSWLFGSDTTFTMGVVVTAAPETLTWAVNPPPNNTVYTSAGAGITDWLKITITLNMSNSGIFGATATSKTITHNFGSVLAQANYAPSAS